MKIVKVVKSSIIFLPLLMCLCYAIIALRFLSGHLSMNMSLVVGMMLMPYLCSIEKDKRSLRFLIPALLMASLAFLVPARSVFFFFLLFSFLLFLENFIGKVSLLFFFVMVLISPLFKFFSDALSFPLRLWLSRTAADTITFAGIKARSAGNIINIDGFDFYIDQACAGLNMLNLSLLISLFIITFHQRKTCRSLSFLAIISVLVFTFLLNIFSNFFRILLVVIFKIMPGTTMHDLVGLFSLTVYVILPMVWLTGPFVNRFGKHIPKNEQSNKEGQDSFNKNLRNLFSSALVLRYPALQLIFFGIMVYLSLHPQKTPAASINDENIQLIGYQKTILENNVLKFENKEALIYMKPTAFYTPEHNPMVCWTGSGYEFQLINKEVIKGIEVYTGTLIKGKDKIYASWWFDNGPVKTIDQLNWRWQGAKGSKGFYLVNVNAATACGLKKITENLLTISKKSNLPFSMAGNP